MIRTAILVLSVVLQLIGKYSCGNPPAVATANFSSSASSGYYVAPTGDDANDGSAAHPWATIQRASTVRPGAVVHVSSGSYAGPIDTKVSGTADARVRFISDQKWGAKIVAPGTESVWRNAGDYVDIMGFDMTGSTRLGILNYGSHVRVIGNRVHDIPVVGCTSNGGAGINDANYEAEDDDVTGNVITGIGRDGCPRAHGIYHANRGGHIWNNIAGNNQGYGIHLWHAAREVQISNNLVFSNLRGGIIVGAGDAPGDIVDDYTTVTNNLALYNAIGIREYGATGPHNLLANNLVYGNDQNLALLTGTQQATIESDPHFLAYSSDGSGDYHLSAGSPAIDAGTSLAAPPLDAEGVQRPQGRGYDIGPFEFGSQLKRPWPWD